MKAWILGLVAAGLLATGPAPADTLLGERQVAYGSETDVIRLPGKKRYGAIRLCVKRHAVRFRDVDVVYGNGANDDIPVRRIIAAGECTRWVDLRGKRRDIRRIVLRYDTYGNSGPRAVVRAFGR